MNTHKRLYLNVMKTCSVHHTLCRIYRSDWQFLTKIQLPPREEVLEENWVVGSATVVTCKQFIIAMPVQCPTESGLLAQSPFDQCEFRLRCLWGQPDILVKVPNKPTSILHITVIECL